MGDLSQARVVGGAVVTIGADLAGLKSGDAQARSITQGVDRLKADVSIGGDTTRLQSAKIEAVAVAADISRQKSTISVGVMVDRAATVKAAADVAAVVRAATAAAGKIEIPVSFRIDRLPAELDPKWLMNAVSKTGSTRSVDLIKAVNTGALPPPPGAQRVGSTESSAIPRISEIAQQAASKPIVIPLEIDVGPARAALETLKHDVETTAWRFGQSSPFAEAESRARSVSEFNETPRLDGSIYGPGETWRFHGSSANAPRGGDDVVDAEWTPHYQPQKALPPVETRLALYDPNRENPAPGAGPKMYVPTGSQPAASPPSGTPFGSPTLSYAEDTEGPEGGNLISAFGSRLRGAGDLNARAFNTLLRLGVAGRVVGGVARFAASAADPNIGARAAAGDTLRNIDNLAGGPGQSLALLQDNIARYHGGGLNAATGALVGGGAALGVGALGGAALSTALGGTAAYGLAAGAVAAAPVALAGAAVGAGLQYFTGRSIGENIVHATNAIGLTNTMTGDDEIEFARQQGVTDRRFAAMSQRAERAGVVAQYSVTAGDSAKYSTVEAGLSPQDAAAVEAQRNVDTFNTSVRGTAETPEIKAARASIMAQAADAQHRAASATVLQGRLNDSDVAGINAGAADTQQAAAGQTYAAGRSAVAEATRAAVDPYEAQLKQLQDTHTDPAKQVNIAKTIQALKDAGTSNLKAYDDQYANQRNEVLAGLSADIQVRRLRTSGDVEGAAEAGIKAQFAPQIRAAQRNGDTGLASALGDDQQAAIDEQRKQRAFQAEQAIGEAEAQGQAARLRMAGEGQKAELEVFDETTKMRIASLQHEGATTGQIDAEKNQRADERNEVVANQDRQNRIYGGDLQARRDEATATVQGQDKTRSAIGDITAQQDEFENSSDKTPGQRIDLANTQISELKAAAYNLTGAPNRYAQTIDRDRDAPGGANPNGAKDTVAALEKLYSRIDQLTTFVTANGGKLGN